MPGLFTSESVSDGHPDKVCDQISDAILDAALAHDEKLARADKLDPRQRCRVACETLVKDNRVIIAGEITTTADISRADYERIVRQVITDIGYKDPALGFDAETCEIMVFMGRQSPDIADGVDPGGAGDQGMMFGYASDETDALMPAPITYAHRLMQRHAEVRRQVPWMRPDAKCQLTFCYDDRDRPVGIHTVVFSTQHEEMFSDREKEKREIEQTVREEIINPVLPQKWLSAETIYHFNPTGRFVIGGPVGDSGLTGRKIIVDTYGGMARHGGGAFSGKDPSKVDRSAAYAARYIAKNIVAAGLARRCEVQISYAIGVAEPVSIRIEAFGTGKVEDARIEELVWAHFDLRPRSIVEALALYRPIYRKTAAFGHFGRDDKDFTWEACDRADALREAAGL